MLSVFSVVAKNKGEIWEGAHACRFRTSVLHGDIPLVAVYAGRWMSHGKYIGKSTRMPIQDLSSKALSLFPWLCNAKEKYIYIGRNGYRTL